MNNEDKYKNVYIRVFSIENNEEIEKLEYQAIPEWDSVGHMSLIASLETDFDVELDVDDVIDLSSFNVGKEILQKYGVTF